MDRESLDAFLGKLLAELVAAEREQLTSSKLDERMTASDSHLPSLDSMEARSQRFECTVFNSQLVVIIGTPDVDSPKAGCSNGMGVADMDGLNVIASWESGLEHFPEA